METHKKIIKAFSCIDTNGTGTIAAADMSSVLKRLGFSDSLTEASLARYAAAGCNREEIKYAQFIEWVFSDEGDSGTAEKAAAAASRPDANTQAEVKRLRNELGQTLCICILGGTKFQAEESEALVKAIAKKMSGAKRVTFVTGGMAGVQQTFADNCGDGSLVANLLPVGQSSGFKQGKDMNAGADLDQRKEIFGQLGDVYITVEGGPGVAQEARAAHARGAAIVPLIRTGGASGGMFDFPAEALARPDWATTSQWTLLTDKTASVDNTAFMVAMMVNALIEKLAPKADQ